MTQQSPYRILCVLFNDDALERWIEIATRLTPAGGEIHLRGMVVLPEGKSLSEGAMQAQQWRDSFRRLALENSVVHDEVRVHVDYQPMRRVLEEVNNLKIDLLILQWNGPIALTGGMTTDEILQRVPCDVALLSTPPAADGTVLLSLRGGPNLTLGFRVAEALAGTSPITLFHAADNRIGAPDLELLMRAEPQIQRTVTAVSGIAEGILRESVNQQVIVMGATFRHPEANASASSPVIAQVFGQTQIPLVLVRAYQPETMEFHAPGLITGREDDPSTIVDRWFAENTFHSREFADLRYLMALKEKQGVTISLGLPALNEEETVGEVIRTLKTALMDEVPLLDEIVLIDSNSTDNTVAIAQSLGVETFIHQQVLPEMGAYIGKGEALWKSLHVLKGDIIAWVDTDITNIHPRFVYGIIGPMLKDPHIQYVKGFYQRPIRVGDKLQAGGGGRVTELVARPLFNLFYPELSGVVQPLSGEYAGRRTALEQVPFFSGYGVETGLLIDLLERCGLDSIAQTDLEVRVHHNQPLVGLSKMAFAILQVFIARLEGRYGVQLLEQANRSMKTIVQEPERFALEINQISDVERPPIISHPAYRERHQR